MPRNLEVSGDADENEIDDLNISKPRVRIRPKRPAQISKIRRTGPETPSMRPRTTRVDLPEDAEEEAPASENPPPERDRARPIAPSESREVEFKFYCYRCGQKLKVPLSWAERKYPCIRCKQEIVIPTPPEELS